MDERNPQTYSIPPGNDFLILLHSGGAFRYVFYSNKQGKRADSFQR